MSIPFYSQLHAYRKALVITYLPILTLLVYVGLQDHVPVGSLTMDIHAVAKLPFYIGAVSQLGFLFWNAVAALCLFVFVVTRNSSVPSKRRYFLLCSGILTLILLFDDMFLMHEQVFPNLLAIPESAVKVAHMVLVLANLVVFFSIIKESMFLILALALFLFFISVVVDTIPPLPFFWRFQGMLVEDGTKLLGIVSWFFYYAVFCFETIKITQVRGVPRVNTRR